MLTCEKAIKSPKMSRYITGMALPQFDLLHADVEAKYNEAETARLSKRPRERNMGAGRRFAPSLKDRLLLFYYKPWIVCGMVFNVGQATVPRDISYLEPVVRMCIPLPKKIHKAASKAKSMEDLGLSLIIAGWLMEQPAMAWRRRRMSNGRRFCVRTLEGSVGLPSPAAARTLGSALTSRDNEKLSVLEVMIPGLAVLVDVSEQPIYRPKDDKTQSTTRARPRNTP